ncbi:hypothetical protein [Persephonella sp.]|uniref:pilus assembly protein n=1 Tax=Persephonella sp. TaxID=2060922 RepID=UPI0025F3CC8B|nr:hypothetical protein [Persephonella sp.]
MSILIRTISLILTGFLYASANNYCATPPFLTTSVPPNILFVIDKSGSMSWSAYNPDNNKVGWCDNSNGCGWTYTGNEEGYFIPDKVYEYKGSYPNGLWVETTNSENNCPSTWYAVYNGGSYRGACLNFLLMSRIDLLRWAITGGRPEGCQGFDDVSCDPDLVCSGNTCILETLYNDKVEIPKSRLKGILQIFETEENRPRFGALFYSSYIYGNKVYIGDYSNGQNADPDHPYTYLKRAINYVDPGGGTGTAPAMWEAYDYFKQSNDHKYNNGFSLEIGTYKDPNYFCDYNRENCTPVPCAKNFVILASDGQWNYGYIRETQRGTQIGQTCTIESGYEYNSADPVVPAYKMHKETLRTLTSLSGRNYNISVNGVYALGLFLGGTGEQSLKNIAVYGSFDTTNKDWPEGTNGSYWNGNGGQYPWKDCYMDDCGSGKGSACTPLPPSSSDWDADGDGNPDSFLSAKNALEIKESLLRFIRNILKKTSSGTSVSVLAERTTKGAIVTQALFYPEKYFGDQRVEWIGYLYTYWFLNTKLAQNIREDTDRNKKLNILEDKILKFYTDINGVLKIDVYDSDTSGNPTMLISTKNIEEISYLWDAGEILKNTEALERKIFVPCFGTYCSNISQNLTEFNTDYIDLFKNYLGTSLSEFPSCLGSDIETARKNLVDYIRGDETNTPSCRTRDTGNGIWKLGDIIYSTPRIVNYSNYSVVFTASNDGILHAFKVGKIDKINIGNDIVELIGDNLGSEIWGFIPQNALPYLRYLADPNYCHIYINDLSPYIIETDFDNDGKKELILIGGMRLGGGCGCNSSTNCINPPLDVCSDPANDTCTGRSAYYALDITDPENPIFLWEFSHKDLGFSFSGPAYIKRFDNSAVLHHYVMFASGPTSYKGYSSQSLKLFVLDLKTGNLLLKKEISSLNNAFGGKLFTNGLDVNNDGQTDFVFLGYTWKTGTATAKGGIIKIWTGSHNPNDWDFDSTMLNFSQNPITSQIETGKCFGKWYLFFGTGRFFYKEDDDSGINAIYGVPFGCDAENNCPTGTINPVLSATESLACGNIGDPTQGAWMLQLDDSGGSYLKERNIAKPSFVKNTVFFATTQPTSDLCGFGGLSRAWALNCATGDAINSTRCPGYTIENIQVKYLLQLSGGDIRQFGKLDFTEEGGRATKKVYGITSEEGGIPVLPGALKGEIILWIEK